MAQSNGITLSLNVNATAGNIARELPNALKLIPENSRKIALHLELAPTTGAGKAIKKELEEIGADAEKTDVRITQISQAISKLNSISKDFDTRAIGSDLNEVSSQMVQIESEATALREKLRQMLEPNEKGKIEINDTDLKEFLKLTTQIQARYAAVKSDLEAPPKMTGLNALLDQASRIKDQIKNPGANIGAYNEFIQLINEMNIALQTGEGDVNEFKNRLLQLTTTLRDSKSFEETGVMKFWKTFKSQLRNLASGAIIGAVSNALRLLITNVRELNTELTQFKIVTGSTEEEVARFTDSVFKAAEATASSAKDVTNAATVYARLGYSAEESVALSEATLKYSKIAAVEVGDATSNITSILKAFDKSTEEVSDVLDKMAYVGNNFPISASELGTGLANAGSALAAGGNSLEESVALLTAANSSLQDINKASTGLRTITARIRNVKSELQELGEEMDENTDTVAKYREMLINLSGVDIMDGNEFKSTYQIIKELADVWDTLSDTNRAAITTQIAGTRQTNVFEGLIHNFQEAENAITEMGSSASGTADRAMEDVLNSIEGALAKLKESWEKFSNEIINSKLITSAVGFLSGIIGLLNKVFDVPAAGEFVKTLGLVGVAMLAIDFAIKKIQTDAAKAAAITGAVNPWIIGIGAVLAGIVGLIDWINSNSNKVDYSEKIKEDADELKNIQTELQSVEDELKNTKDRISELNALKTSGEITDAQNQELIRLQKQTAEYEYQVSLLKTQEKLKTKDVLRDFSNLYKSPDGSQKTSYSEWLNGSGEGLDAYQYYLSGGVQNKWRGGTVQAWETESGTVGLEGGIDLIAEYQNKIKKYKDIIAKSDNIFLIQAAQNEIDKLSGFIDSYVTELQDNERQISEITGGMDYIDNAESTIERQFNKMVALRDAYQDFLIYAEQGEESIATITNAIISRGRDRQGNEVDYQKAIDNYKQLVKDGKEVNGSIYDTLKYNGFANDAKAMLELFYQLKSRGINVFSDMEGYSESAYDTLKAVINGTINGITNLEDALLSLSDTIQVMGDMKNALSALSSAFNEFADDGAVSFSTIAKISEAFADVSGIEDYIDILSSANLTQEQLSDTLTKLGGEYLYSKAASAALKEADEDLVASMLKEAGVANSVEVAHQMARVAKLNAQYATVDFSKITAAEINDLIAEATQLGYTKQEIYAYLTEKILSNKTQIVEASTISWLQAVAKQAGVSTQALQYYAKAKFYAKRAAKGGRMQQLYEYKANYYTQKAVEASDTIITPTPVTPVYTYTGSGNKSSGAKGSGGGSSSSSDNSDSWKEAYDKERKALDHLRKMEYITEEVYYSKLNALNQKYFAGRAKYLDEYNSNLEELHEGFKSLFNEDWDSFERRLDAFAEDDYAGREKLLNEGKKLIISESQRYRKELAPYLSTYDINNSDFIRELGDKWGNLNDQLKQLSIDRLNDQSDALDQIVQNEEDMLNRSAGTQVQIEREKQRLIEKAYKDGVLTFKEYIEQMNNSLAAEMDALQDNYDTALSTINTYIDEKIDALQTENDELEKQKELQDSLNELEKARTQRNKRLYVEGIGFIWTADQEAIKAAEDRYSELTSNNALDEEIKYWENLRTSLEDILGMADKEYDNDVTEMLLGEDWKSKLEEGEKFIRAFADAYVGAVDAIQGKSKESNSQGTVYPDTGLAIDRRKYTTLRGYADGGVANFTGLARLHGTPDKPETIFNSVDSAKLYSLIHNTPNLTELVYHDLVSSAKAGNITSTNGVNIDLGGILINGNADQTTIDSMSEMLDRKIIQMSNMIRQTSLQKSYNQWGVN